MIISVPKFPKRSRLSPNQRQELIIFLCQAIQSLRNEEEVAKFLTDLLSPPEIEMLSKRLEVAMLIIQGYTYADIRKKLNVGFNTISRIQAWTQHSGEGFKIALGRRKKTATQTDRPPSFHDELKRKYPGYYWPEILIDTLLKASDVKHQKIIQSLVDKMVVK
jgi:TrpR-related protein YerC/YecD